MLFGIEFFDKDDNLILSAGTHDEDDLSKEVVLEDGERLIGVNTRLFRVERLSPQMEDFRFIIG
jgi:hypothetical protein